MLREPQHERKMVNVINVISVRPELSRRASHFFHTLSAFLSIQLVDDALLIELPDKAWFDESLRVGGFGARVARGGEVEYRLDGGGHRGRSAGKLFDDERLVGVLE